MMLRENPQGGFDIDDEAEETAPMNDAGAVIPLLVSDDDGGNGEAAQHLPHGLMISGSKIYLAKDEDKDPIEICDLFEVVAHTKDETGRNHGRLLRIKGSNGHWHSLALPLKELDEKDIIKTLRDYGVSINPVYQQSAAYVRAYIQDMPPKRHITCVTKTGWYGNAYVSPHGTFPPDANLVLQMKQARRGNMGSKGTLESWQQHIAQPCRFNHRYVLVLTLAFAAPLLPLVSDESGGVHMVGNSSMGKTTMLMVACSVVGSPEYKQQWRVTDNGLELSCSSHNHMLLVLDEIGQVDPKKLADIVYMVANGQAKTRSTSNITLREADTWQLLFLSSGEITIGDKIREGGKAVRAGVGNRAVDIPADAGCGFGSFDTLHDASNGAAFSNQLKDAAAEHYGTAFPAFMEYIIPLKESLPARFALSRDRFLMDVIDGDADGQVSRVAERFALIAFAGELAIEAGILPYGTGEAVTAAKTCFHAWIMQRGGQGAFEKSEALKQVQHFLELHQASRFQKLNDGESEPSDKTVNLAGYIKEIDGQEYFLFQPQVFRQDVCAGLDYRFVCNVLKDAGFLVTSEKALTYQVKVKGSPKRFYTVKTSLLDEVIA